MRFLQTMAHLSPWVTVLACVVLLASTILFLTRGPASDLKKLNQRLPERPRLDGYDTVELARYLHALDNVGSLSLYQRQLQYDVGFAFFYGICFFLVLAGTFGRMLPGRLSALHWFAFIPIFGAAMDIFEDLLLLRSVHHYNSTRSFRPNVVTVASVCTRAKWLLLLFSVLVLLVGVALLVVQWLQ